MARPDRYRPYYSDYCAHCLRHYLAREQDPEPEPFEKLSECSKLDLLAAGEAISEMNCIQQHIINECYSPVTNIAMFWIQFRGACEHLGIGQNAAWAELGEALYRVAWHRGLIGKPIQKYRKLYGSDT